MYRSRETSAAKVLLTEPGPLMRTTKKSWSPGSYEYASNTNNKSPRPTAEDTIATGEKIVPELLSAVAEDSVSSRLKRKNELRSTATPRLSQKVDSPGLESGKIIPEQGRCVCNQRDLPLSPVAVRIRKLGHQCFYDENNLKPNIDRESERPEQQADGKLDTKLDAHLNLPMHHNRDNLIAVPKANESTEAVKRLGARRYRTMPAFQHPVSSLPVITDESTRFLNRKVSNSRNDDVSNSIQPEVTFIRPEPAHRSIPQSTGATSNSSNSARTVVKVEDSVFDIPHRAVEGIMSGVSDTNQVASHLRDQSEKWDASEIWRQAGNSNIIKAIENLEALSIPACRKESACKSGGLCRTDAASEAQTVILRQGSTNLQSNDSKLIEIEDIRYPYKASEPHITPSSETLNYDERCLFWWITHSFNSSPDGFWKKSIIPRLFLKTREVITSESVITT